LLWLFVVGYLFVVVAAAFVESGGLEKIRNKIITWRKIGKRQHFAKHGNIGTNLMAGFSQKNVICLGWILTEKIALQ